MTDRLGIRLTSFVLSVIVTLSVVVGLQTLAHAEHAAGVQVSQAATSDGTGAGSCG